MVSIVKKIIIASAFIMVSFLFPFCGKDNGTTPPPPPPPIVKTFINPLLNGADPWIYKKDGFYYYLQTVGNRVALWRTNAVSKLGLVTNTEIYKAPAGAANAENVWAPEIHFLDGKWYVYYTAGAGPDDTQRTWVLENTNADPLAGTWVSKGRIFTTDADFWAIDGTVLDYNNSRYFVWCGRPVSGIQNQNIYIAKMVNPWTLEAPTAMISNPLLGWEINGGPVNEAPQILKNSSGKVFLLFSASGCWTDDYALGMLTLKDGGNPLLPVDWVKQQQPVFTKNPGGNAYGPGHNGFFKSPDGTEDWIMYHANTSAGQGCGVNRNIRIQKFIWNADGTPNFGKPVQTGVAINLPSGE